MSLVVVGSMAFDDIETPFGKSNKIIGGAAILTSIPLFIASGKNKKRAKLATASIDLQPTFNPYQFTVKNIPALSLRFRLCCIK